MQWTLQAVLALPLVLPLLGLPSTSAVDLPHINECNFCDRCYIRPEDRQAAAAAARKDAGASTSHHRLRSLLARQLQSLEVDHLQPRPITVDLTSGFEGLAEGKMDPTDPTNGAPGSSSRVSNDDDKSLASDWSEEDELLPGSDSSYTTSSSSSRLLPADKDADISEASEQHQRQQQQPLRFDQQQQQQQQQDGQQGVHHSTRRMAAASAGGASARDPPPLFEWEVQIAPHTKEVDIKNKLRNCTECWGCSAEIHPLKAQMGFGRNWSVEKGASPEWLFFADTPETKAQGKRLVIKVWCMPIDKVQLTWRWVCKNERDAIRATQFLVAQQRVVEECGLMDMTIKVWLAPVNAVIPGQGFHIWWQGLWMTKAEGVSMNQLSYITTRAFVRDTMMGLLQNRLNKTRVVRAALYDLLTCQCDRHSQNLFVQEDGNFQLIDNQQALRFNWQYCGADSIFLPGTQKNELVRFGGNLVGKKLGARPKRSINPMLLLDYRCYVEGGQIGKNYPPELAQCLRKLSGMTPQAIMQQYGFPDNRSAEALHQRATGMLEKGFEWSLKYGEPLNRPGKRYKWHQPCCKLDFNERGDIVCGHKWDVKEEFPKGDPISGLAWKASYSDPGTYTPEDIV